MMKKTLVLFSLLTTCSLVAQEVVATQGDSYSSGSGSVDFTIGEVVINTGTDGTNDITQGFHQTNWHFLGVDEHSAAFEINIYPNPTSELMYIKTIEFKNAVFVLYDVNGKLVLNGLLDSELTEIKVATLLPGEYFLSILRGEQKLKTFNLLKIR